jgi:uncharacterized phage-associated protein
VATVETYSPGQIEKLGNAIIFLCNKISPWGPVSKTHILKLVFILDEISIKKYGIPLLGLRYDLWKLGPVSKDLYIELTEEPNLLSNYISKSLVDNKYLINPIREFSDDEFSDQEMQLMEEVSERFKLCTTRELINFTHRNESPWYITAQQNGLLDDLESGKMNATNIEVDMSLLLQNDEIKLARYHDYLDFLAQTKKLKS